MRDFFRGWRRKWGCITLLIACVVTAAWVRSLHRLDQFRISPESQSPIYLLQSVNGSVRWICDESRGAEIYLWMTRTRNDEPHRFTSDERQNSKPEWKLQWLGFRAYQASPIEMVWFIPYWFLSIPLTFLAAYLILSTPRPKPK